MNRITFRFALVFVGLLPFTVAPLDSCRAASAQILGWNNLGMHCMDSDYTVFSVLPPYNTIEAQLIVNGLLLTSANGYTVTYQAVADPDGSINASSVGKGNFSQYDQVLYGVHLAPETGLLGWAMPGLSNTPQAMLFENTNTPAPGVHTPVNWFRAEGIPITPFDDAGAKNPYPLMRLIARNGVGAAIATNDIVLPVSDEMDCRACHASGTQTAAQPAAGWVWSGNPERDYRLNILRLHDEHQFASNAALYADALAARGFNPQGLYRGVVADDHSVLCAACHASEALGTGSYSNIPPLTASVHSKHAGVMDPELNLTLDHAANRAACYRCHPGSATKCLRGAMGGAIAADGSMAMQCQSCHGNMSAVGDIARVGWFMEPNCQSCHTGTATSNNGQIRYTSCFETNGSVRVATNQTFATNPDIPAPGISLYRFSAGHGGLQCSACHGSTHAEFPATHRNDNLRNERLQGHAGMMVECTACHTAMPNTITGGPHGLHPIGGNWATNHGDLFEGSPAAATRQQCQVCHGTTYRGTVLSRAQNTRVFSTKFGSRTFWRGKQIGCYDCHNGANSGDPSANSAPVVTNVSTNTGNAVALSFTLPASDANGNPLTFRVVAQPASGSVGVSNNVATYFPEPGFTGAATFTFAANDGYVDSNLGTGTVAVVQGVFSIGATAYVPASYPADWPAAFAVVPAVTNHAAPVTFAWDFGDGSSPSTNQYATHAYAGAGDYNWQVVSTVAGLSATNSGTIAIGSPMLASAAEAAHLLTLAWPRTLADAVLETSAELVPAQWSATTNVVNGSPASFSVTVLNPLGNAFFRLRQVQ